MVWLVSNIISICLTMKRGICCLYANEYCRNHACRSYSTSQKQINNFSTFQLLNLMCKQFILVRDGVTAWRRESAYAYIVWDMFLDFRLVYCQIPRMYFPNSIL